MKTRKHPARCAGPAIAAVLALGSIPAMAQVADPLSGASGAGSQQAEPMVGAPVMQSPVAPVPESAPADGAPAQQQVIVLPPQPPVEASPPPQTVSQPVVQQVEPGPAPEVVAEEPEPAAAPTPLAAQEPVGEAPVAESSGEAAANAEVAPVAEEAPTESDAAAEVIAAPPVPVSAPIETDIAERAEPGTVETIGYAGMIVSALAVIGLLLLSAFAFRRRRKSASVPTLEKPVVAPLAEAAREEKPAVDPVTVREDAPTPVSDIRDWAQATSASSSVPRSQLREGNGTGGLQHAGAAVALPNRIPDTFEERDRLLKRMVAAKPDRANPFVSPKARLRRARLILQSLGRRFENGSRIDLSQYPTNWPELARRDYPTAA